MKKKTYITLAITISILLGFTAPVISKAFKKKAVQQVTATKHKKQVQDNINNDDENKKIVYLTFDDGPSSKTPKILDILKENNAHATFFVTAQNPQYKNLMKRTLKEGHAIGAHSYTHQYSIYQSEQTYFDDLNKIEDYIQSVTGKKTDLVRFPGGSSNTISRHYAKGIMKTLADDLEKKGYKYYDWNISSGDAESPAPASATILSNSTKGTYNHIVLLMHDASTKQSTVDALPGIIKYYRNQGYTFKSLDQSNITCHHKINN